MKQSVFPRMAGLLFLYLGVFVVLVMIQFAKQDGFTRRVGDMTVSGNYGPSAVRTADLGGESPADVYSLEGGVNVSVGGLEFRLHNGGEFGFLRSGGEKHPLSPLTMSVYGGSVVFGFEDGMRLVFNAQNAAAAGGPELRITGQFGEEYEGLELPYRVLRTSRVRDDGDGRFVVIADGIPYSFEQSHPDDSRRVLVLRANDAIAYYRAVQERSVPEHEGSVPENFILAEARDESLYNETVNRWRDEVYSFWSRTAGTTDDEGLVAAYAGESVDRGVYRDVVAGISPSFLRRASWTYNASVYLGRLDLGLRSLSAFEREAVARLSALATAGSEDLFLESRIVEFCGIRGYGQILDAVAELARSLDPASLSPDLILGILEGYADWRIYRFRDDNPFENLIESACLAVYGGIRENTAGDQVLYYRDGRADTEYNLRLGLALDRYGRIPGREEWGALGRSLAVSVLSLTENGSLPSALIIPGAEEADQNAEIPGLVNPIPSRARIDALSVYRLFPAAAYPHAVSIDVPASGVWAWTASDSVTVSRENNVLDIAVSFPAGETHYMLIRGLRPFVKLQLYGIDYRTDPQFERYDSSGWSFSSSEQTLLLKLKHRSQIEHIRVFY
ncbi:MAG: hypothetical protein LBH57_07900 [Treponema sp.]|jgi:hypothetical protein|nr:hypothetical protein [Treponema sp.]